MYSGYNCAFVQAVAYTGPPTTLSWELQHSLCAAAGRATPGSDLSGVASCPACRRDTTGMQDKNCAYSADDNYVVARGCGWYYQEFTHVSGTLGGGVGYMCAGSVYGDCDRRVRVEGTTADGHTSGQVTLNGGDAVFCSA